MLQSELIADLGEEQTCARLSVMLTLQSKASTRNDWIEIYLLLSKAVQKRHSGCHPFARARYRRLAGARLICVDLSRDWPPLETWATSRKTSSTIKAVSIKMRKVFLSCGTDPVWNERDDLILTWNSDFDETWTGVGDGRGQNLLDLAF